MPSFLMGLLKKIACGPLQTNTHLIVVQEKNGVVVVDPGPGSFAAVTAALQQKGALLLGIWLTHSHWDHTADCHLFLSQGAVPLLVHEADAENLTHPGADGLSSFVSITPAVPSGYLKDRQILEDQWVVLHTPGHSMGSVCFYHEGYGLLLSGDTLFRGTRGNTTFPYSSPALMKESLALLSTLPEQTRILPGHGPETTLGREVAWMKAAATLPS